MKTCPACETEVMANDRFCIACGTLLATQEATARASQTSTCPACGAAFDPADRFCAECGRAVISEAAAQPSVASEALETVARSNLGDAPSIASLESEVGARLDGLHASDPERLAAKEREQRQRAAWEAVRNTTDVKVLEAFLRDWPGSPYKAEALRLKNALRRRGVDLENPEVLLAAKEREQRQRAAWEGVRNTTDVKVLEAFLRDWPGSPYKAEALELKQALRGGGFLSRIFG